MLGLSFVDVKFHLMRMILMFTFLVTEFLFIPPTSIMGKIIVADVFAQASAPYGLTLLTFPYKLSNPYRKVDYAVWRDIYLYTEKFRIQREHKLGLRVQHGTGQDSLY